jgi:2-C-methyl-D-erythritol 4-phosphate cytidylyltransferase
VRRSTCSAAAPDSWSRPAAARASAPEGRRHSSRWPAARWSPGRSTRSPRAVVAVPPGHGAAAEEALASAPSSFPLGFALVEGGAARSESVRNALAAAGDVEAVVVHDAARPLATPELFRRTLAGLAAADGAIAAARVTDTVKEAGPDGFVVRTHDRSQLWAIQTPQAFRTATLRRALDVPADVLAAATDDAWLVERAGGSVRVIESPRENFKVTTPHDLAIAESLLC